jgi:hypothetical protein
MMDLCSNYGFCTTPEEENFIYVLVGVVFFLGVYLRISSQGIMLHVEGDFWKEIFENASYWQRVTGNIPSFTIQKRPLP